MRQRMYISSNEPSVIKKLKKIIEIAIKVGDTNTHYLMLPDLTVSKTYYIVTIDDDGDINTETIS